MRIMGLAGIDDINRELALSLLLVPVHLINQALQVNHTSKL